MTRFSFSSLHIYLSAHCGHSSIITTTYLKTKMYHIHCMYNLMVIPNLYMKCCDLSKISIKEHGIGYREAPNEVSILLIDRTCGLF